MPNEALDIKLDSSKANLILNWRSLLNLNETILWTFEWHMQSKNADCMAQFTRLQIDEYEKLGCDIC